ncbi:MAG TPA: hypothetical protein DCQ34_10990 [Chitinophagaceae bacterium]|nr:hypothetical protein [Chitinophagaceae bacterium]
MIYHPEQAFGPAYLLFCPEATQGKATGLWAGSVFILIVIRFSQHYVYRIVNFTIESAIS